MNLNDPIFTDEAKARAYFEAIRWPDGKPVCPHCGCDGRVYRLEGKSHRPGLMHCNDCDGSFTVTTGGVMESSHIPLTKWALGFRLMAASKKGVSAHQLHRMLGITYKSAWFMAHRIREAMAPEKKRAPMGGEGKIIEVDETYIGKKRGRKRGTGMAHKHMVVALVERGGEVRSFHVKGSLNKAKAKKALFDNVDLASEIVSDEARAYEAPGANFAQHASVNHSKGEYARGDLHTNTIEGYFSVFKRGMIGTYQHVGEQHLQRYLHEFDFRQSNRAAVGVNDDVRTERAVHGAAGKRLTYQ